MACGVALKRSLDIDMLLSPENSIKRRRTSTAGHCSPYNPAIYTSPPSSSSTSVQTDSIEDSSKFGAYQSDLQQYIRAEIRSKRRRILPTPGGRPLAPGSPSSSGSDSDHETQMDSLSHDGDRSKSILTANCVDKTKYQPLFTLHQVQIICERLLKEQTEKLRDEYNQILKARMAEQYDTFVRFTYDQIHNNLQSNTMSYLS